MLTLFVVLIVAACILLMLVILVQNPKGGGLSAAFGGQSTSQMLGGVKRSGDFLDKATWGLALVIFVMVLGVGMFSTIPSGPALEQSEISGEIEGASPEININQSLEAGDAAPTQAPVESDPEAVEE